MVSFRDRLKTMASQARSSGEPVQIIPFGLADHELVEKTAERMGAGRRNVTVGDFAETWLKEFSQKDLGVDLSEELVVAIMPDPIVDGTGFFFRRKDGTGGVF